MSMAVLQSLLAKGIRIDQVILAKPSAQHFMDIPVLNAGEYHRVELECRRLNIRISTIPDPATFKLEISKLEQGNCNTFWRQAPDFLVTACFPYLLPQRLINMAQVAALNLHPSLLPGYRGPHPVFWQLRHGANTVGISLHFLEPEVDAGALLAQSTVDLSFDCSHDNISEKIGKQGVELLSAVLTRPQDFTPIAQTHGISYYPAPTAVDFELDLSWTAQHAFNFMSGTTHWSHPYSLKLKDSGRTSNLQTSIQLSRALDCKPQEHLQQTIEREGNILKIQFSQGVLVAREHKSDNN
ncbi:MAG: formyltransferase family protein [Gammaproteobacteria bacterium]|nr:formyltransferase family protein [Gammaproteobacteria bacterium]MDH5802040.1 formyltransferase family protein [Gammaproteobacteria bacterium]